VAARVQHRQRKHNQREDRQEMDRAERPDHLDLVNEERAQGNHRHQGDPDPADRAVRQRALGRRKLHNTEHKRAHRREGVNLDHRLGLQQRRQRHLPLLQAVPFTPPARP
jgi:hypothetical protein